MSITSNTSDLNHSLAQSMNNCDILYVLGTSKVLCWHSAKFRKIRNTWYLNHALSTKTIRSTLYLVWRMLTVTVICTITPFAKHELVWIASLLAYLYCNFIYNESNDNKNYCYCLKYRLLWSNEYLTCTISDRKQID